MTGILTNIMCCFQRHCRAAKAIVCYLLIALTTSFFSFNVSANETDNDKPVFLAQTGPPPGFEDLLKPQTTAIDIYYGQRYLLTTLATFTPNFLELHTPQHILNFIPDVLDRKKILQALSQPLANNNQLICRNNRSNCGSLNPTVAGVIFNPDAFRADLFINPLFLPVQKPFDQQYLPPSTADWSLIQALNASVSGQTGQDNRHSFIGLTTIGKSQSRLQSQWAHRDTTGMYLETLHYAQDYQQYLFQGGLFRSQSYGLAFTNEQKIFGASAATSLETRTDLSIARGSEIQVFFPSRSRVEIYKDGRLIDARFYDTGNQILDTSRFPEGSYNVTLRIREESGLEREESYFFAKSRKLPPLGTPQYFAELGNVILDNENNFFPELSSTWALRSGYAKRINDKTGISAGGLITNNLLLTELGVAQYGLNYELESSLMFTTEKDTGFTATGRYRWGSISTYLYYRQVAADKDSNQDDPATLEPTDYWDPVPISSTQSNIGVNMNIGSGNLNMQYRKNERDNEPSENGYSIRYLQNFLALNTAELQFSAELSDFDSGSRFLIGLRLVKRTDRWTHNLDTNYESQEDAFGESENALTFNGSSRWKDGELFDSDLEAVVRAGHEISRDYIGGDIEYDSSLGMSNFTLEHGSNNDSDYTLYAGNATFNFAATKNNFAFGGSRLNSSGVIIDLSGQAKKGSFDVYVNNQKHGRIRSGRRSIISLAPYKTYAIFLKPSVDTYVDFDNKAKSVTLYPGNVHRLTWSTESLVIIYGRAVDASGTAIENAQVKGVKGMAFSDNMGLFQAEVNQTTDALDFKTSDKQCSVNLPEFPKDKTILNLGTLVCE